MAGIGDCLKRVAGSVAPRRARGVRNGRSAVNLSRAGADTGPTRAGREGSKSARSCRSVNGHYRPFAMFCRRLDRRQLWAESCRCAATLGGQNSSTSTGDLLCPLYVDSSRPCAASRSCRASAPAPAPARANYGSAPAADWRRRIRNRGPLPLSLGRRRLGEHKIGHLPLAGTHNYGNTKHGTFHVRGGCEGCWRPRGGERAPSIALSAIALLSSKDFAAFVVEDAQFDRSERPMHLRRQADCGG